MIIGRRGLITGLVSFLAAPAIVRAASLMPVCVQYPLLTPTVDVYVSDFGLIERLRALTPSAYIEELYRRMREGG